MILNRPNLCHLLVGLVLVVTSSSPLELRAAAVELKIGDHICLVGNGLGEALQHSNDWETLLHTRFPQHQLVVRNLCFPADEPHSDHVRRTSDRPTITYGTVVRR